MDKDKEGWKTFLTLCSNMPDEKNFSTLLDLLLTPDEKNAISMRCLIVRDLLLNEQTQREIAKNLNVSIAKITRGSNELKRIKPSFLSFIKEKMAK